MTEEAKASRAALTVLAKTNGSGKLSHKKPSRWLYPFAAEHRYAQSYRAWVKPVCSFVNEYLKKHGDVIFRGDSKEYVARMDAVTGRSFSIMVDSLNGWVDAYLPSDEDKIEASPVFRGLESIADSTFEFNGKQYDKAVKSALGVKFPSDESWWVVARKQWALANYNLIQSDLKRYIADINSVTELAVTNGWSVKILSEKINSIDTKLSRNRANFIARDQTGKLNGTVSQHRMEDIGLTMYEWSSANDESVRESHALMEGLLCRWDDASVYSDDNGKTWKPRPSGAVLMHPGMDYQCRCVALAWFNEIIDGIAAL